MEHISIHALREEGDWRIPFHYTRQQNFYPRPPRGGRLVAYLSWFDALEISIHALREEGDPNRCGGQRNARISIHALREEGDAAETMLTNGCVIFLSTPSARRATRSLPIRLSGCPYFYPRPPRGGRPAAQC